MGACKIQAKDLVRTRRYVHSGITYALTNDTPSLLKIHTKILLHAHPTASHIPPHPNCAIQRANDAINERRHLPARQHEQADEPTSFTENSYGV